MGVTIRDVAKEAGVSTATVSKVMNNSPSIPDSTAQRIRQVMDKLNYHPNARARNFASQSTKIIVFAANFRRNLAFENPHIFEMMTGLSRSLSDKGYTLTPVNVTKGNCAEILGDLISRKGADGIVLHVSIITRELEKKILAYEFPHIILGRPEYSSQLCWIDNNNVVSGEIAARHLKEKGYKRLAFLGGSKSDVGSMDRLQGFKNVFEEDGQTVPKERIFYGESTIESGIEGMNKFLSLQERPDAIMCANNNMALGAYYALSDRRMKVPDDIALITFDAYPYTKITRPRTTTVDIDVYEMGRLAGELISKKIKKPQMSIQSVTTFANLIKNASV